MVRTPWTNSTLTGPQWIRRSLERLGVEFVFGLPGTQNSTIFDELSPSPIRVIVPTHELAASLMANGYARTARRPAVLLTIPGPGFTYALSGIAEARLDSAALVWICIAPKNHAERRFQLQAIEQHGIAKPLVKAVFEVEDTAEIARALGAAYQRAQSGEPGPVLVHLHEKALAGEARWEDPPEGDGFAAGGEASVDRAGDSPADPEPWREAARRIEASRKPLVIAGQGALGAADALRAFVERRRALVLTTTSGRGALPEDHPLSLGWECSGTRTGVLDELVEESDVVLALGVKFSHNAARGFRWKIPREKLIHVDTSEDVLGANYPAAIEVCADAGAFLREFEPDGEGGWSDEEAAHWKAQGRRRSWIEAPEPLLLADAPAAFFRDLREVLPRDAIVVTDSGLHQLLCRRWFRVDAPGGLLTPTDFQSMGFGLPAAIGAALAAPSRRVVVVMGDGGLLMSGLEMVTATKYDVSLLVLVINDGSYGLIRREQLAVNGIAEGSTLANPLFGDLAHAAHANYLSLGPPVHEGLRQALALQGVTLVEVRAEDSPSLVRLRSKGVLKRVAGTRMVKWLKGLLGGG